MHARPRPRPENHALTMLRTALIAACAAAVLLPAGASGAAAPAPCRLPTAEQRTFGPTYVETIRQTGTTCTRAKQLVRAFQKCRRAHGVRGRCTRKVSGYACREQRASVPTQLTAKVTCTKGRAIVVHTYTELLS